LNTTYTTAKVHDSQVSHALMTGNESGEAYGDSAYTGKEKIAFLEAMGIENQIHDKAVRGTALSDLQKERNRIKSSVRARVEHPFATLKTRY
jgi:IS5 family transposase